MTFFMVFFSRARNMVKNADFLILSYSSFIHDTVEFEVLTALLNELQMNMLIASTSCRLVPVTGPREPQPPYLQVFCIVVTSCSTSCITVLLILLREQREMKIILGWL